MMKVLPTAAAVLVTSALSALAADLPSRPAPVYVQPPIAPLWTGPFVGIGLGGAFGGDSGNSINGKSVFCSLPVYCNSSSYGSDFGYVKGGGSGDSSFAVSGQIGYNYQIPGSQFVIGGVADFTWLDRSSSRSISGPTVTVQNEVWQEQAFYYDSFKQDWLATARVKVGVAFDNMLVFATGGLALGNIKSSSKTETVWTPPSPDPAFTVISGSGSTSATAVGWALGAGLEYRIAPNWSIFAEYLYYSLEDSYNVNVASYAPLAPDTKSYRVKAEANGSLIKVGINYLFWTPPPPVVVPTVVSVRN